MNSSTQRYHERIASGQCGYCGRKTPKKNRKLCSDCLNKMNRNSKVYQRRMREAALKKIAEFWGDNTLRCRIDLTPATPVSDFPCRGKLQIDHLNGEGCQERNAKGDSGMLMVREIVHGRRIISDLRLLCQLHQLWNVID